MSGKGSTRRPGDDEAFASNYERIFGAGRPTPVARVDYGSGPRLAPLWPISQHDLSDAEWRPRRISQAELLKRYAPELLP